MDDDRVICEAIHAIERLVGCRPCPPSPSLSLLWTIGPVREQALPDGPGVRDMANLVLTDSQQCDLNIQPVDKKGNPAQVDGVPVWGSSDETVLTVQPSADGLGATIIAGNPGTAQVNVTADADLGAGTVPISGVLDVEVTAGTAVSVAITAGTPTEQP